MVVFLQDLLSRPPAREQIDNELDGDTGPLNDWFPDQYVGINGNSIVPVHTALRSARYKSFPIARSVNNSIIACNGQPTPVHPSRPTLDFERHTLGQRQVAAP